MLVKNINYMACLCLYRIRKSGILANWGLREGVEAGEIECIIYGKGEIDREASNTTCEEPIKVRMLTFSCSDSESVQPSYSNASQERSFPFPLLFISPNALAVAEFKEFEGE